MRFIYDRVVALLHNNDTIVLSIHLDRYIIDTRNDLWRWTILKLDFYLCDRFMYLKSKIYGDFCAMLLSNWIETCSHLQQKLIFNSKISNTSSFISKHVKYDEIKKWKLQNIRWIARNSILPYKLRWKMQIISLLNMIQAQFFSNYRR